MYISGYRKNRIVIDIEDCILTSVDIEIFIDLQ